MVIVGMWIAIVGYGVAYAGVVTLGGGQCGLIDAFRGKCAQGSTRQTSTGPSQGVTILASQQAQQAQQAGMIGATPIQQA